MRAYSDLLAVGYTRLPASIRVNVVELVIGSLVVMVFPLVVVVVYLVVMVFPLVFPIVVVEFPLVILFQNVGEAVAGRDCGSCINDVGTGTVKSYGIE